MQSPLKRIIVYDFETGGLNVKYNPVTEMAGVVLEMETLEIVEEFSVMFLPRLDLSVFEESPMKEAKLIFNDLAQKDEETNIKSLVYKGEKITLKSLDSLSRDIAEFREHLNKRENGSIITWEEYSDYQKNKSLGFSDITEVYFNRCYNPQALEITHMSIELMLREGVSYEEAFKQIEALISRHTIGNNKPIISGHNIKNFDNPFMVKIFSDNKADFLKVVNTFMIDTLEWVRLIWTDLPSFSLGVCANALGLTLKEAHRALPDTIANAKVLQAILLRMRSSGMGDEKEYTRDKYKFSF
jgi:DNA polymerase III alpha subunit (gram-positive type)